MILDDVNTFITFNTFICFGKLNSNYFKATQVSKATGIDNLSGHFLKGRSKFYPNLSKIYVISQLPLKSFVK